MSVWRVSRRAVGLAVILTVLLAAVATGLRLTLAAEAAPTSPGLVLAQSHPSAAVFLQMAVRGGIDYFVVERQAAADLQQIVANGNTPYQFPTAAQLSYRVIDGKSIEVASYGVPVWDDGQLRERRKFGRGLPEPGLQTETALPAAAGATSLRYRANQFEGAQYLAAGMALEEFRAVQLRLHLLDFLARATVEQIASTGEAPRSLVELEAFLGVQRNPAGWKGVQLAASSQQVPGLPGNLYFGQNGKDKLLLRINLGPEVADYRFARIAGQWSLERGVLVY